jgi:hypothetical protein
VNHFEINRIGGVLVISAIASGEEISSIEAEEKDEKEDVEPEAAGFVPEFPRRITLQGWLLSARVEGRHDILRD